MRDPIVKGVNRNCILLDFEPSGGRYGLNLLRHGELQHAVGILCLDAINIHAGHIEATAVGTIETLALDEVLLLVFLVHLALGGDGQTVVLNVDLDVFLLEAGEFGIQNECVAGVVTSVRKELSAAWVFPPKKLRSISSSIRKGS